MASIQLRDYQQRAVEALRLSYATGHRRPLLVLPTGGGKTFVFSYIAQGATAKGSKVLILVHRKELLLQASASLDRLGVKHGLIASGLRWMPYQAQVASVQTLVKRVERMDWHPDLIVVDEAHHATAGSWAAVIAAYPSARVLGVTATPCRTDGRGLGDVFDDMVEGPTIAELTDRGFLAPTKIYAPPIQADLTGLRTRMGDYAKDQLSQAMDRPSITGDAVEHYRRICPGAPAIAFCVSVEHAHHVAEQFNAAGFKAASLDGSMDSTTRSRLIDDLGNGRLQVLTSCDIVSEGTDIPVVTAALLLRPTQSLGLYLQQCGRILRPAPGKTHAIVLDHVGNVARHGLPEMEREWSLEGEKRRKRKAGDPVEQVRQCPDCFCAHAPQTQCPNCGHRYAVQAREVQQVSGELIEIDKAAIARQRRAEQAQAQTLEELIELGRRRGYKPGWAQKFWAARHRKQQQRGAQNFG